MPALERARAQVHTVRLDGTGQEYLGRLGHVADLTWTDVMPGGNDQLTCTLQIPPTRRPAALDAGRIVRVVKGASVQFEGTLDEPAPGAGGWSVTARGAGTWGGLYQAVYSTWTAGDIIAQAAGRGLRWAAGNLGTGYLTEIRDSGSLTVTDFLNLYTQPGSQVWRVHRTPAGNQLDVFPVPVTPTRLLITTVPAARTLAGYYNCIWVRYQSAADTRTAAATYAVTPVTNAASIARHGRQETYWDVSSGGVMTAAQAQALGSSALAKFTAASWSGPFQVSAGQYLTMGGAAVDLACEHAGEVARLVLADGPYGGEVTPAPPVQFPVGKVEYRDSDGTLTVTPLQSWTSDLPGITSWYTPRQPPAAATPTTAKKR